MLVPSVITLGYTWNGFKAYAGGILMTRLILTDSGRARRLALALIVGLFISSTPLWRAHAADGDLDPTFGVGGRVTTSFPGNGGVLGLVIQPDGKIVAAGPSGVGFALARYEANGNLDSTFGSAGKVTTDSPGFLFFATSIARQSNGKLVVAGSAINVNSGGLNFGLARYNSNGSLDTTFGGAGTVTTDFGVGFAQPNAVGIQTDNKIVAAGYVSRINDDGTGQDFALARYNPDGSPDITFGVSGKVITNVAAFGEGIAGLAIQPDNSVLVAGVARFTSAASSSTFTLARYLESGVLDSSFGTNGIVTTDFGPFSQAVAIGTPRPNTVIAAGSAGNDFALAQYDSFGHLDPSFGAGGKVTTDLFGGTDGAWSMVVRPNGKIVLGGTAFVDATFAFAIAQYTSSGALDTTFGNGGKVATSFPGSRQDVVRSLALQTDGRLVAGGISTQATSDVFALARYGSGFDICIQDDSNGSFLLFNSTTGEYVFTNCRGVTLGGTGSLTKKGSLITLQQNGPDRRLLAQIDRSVNRGSASLQVFSPSSTFTIIDRNTLNDTCSCPTPP